MRRLVVLCRSGCVGRSRVRRGSRLCGVLRGRVPVEDGGRWHASVSEGFKYFSASCVKGVMFQNWIVACFSVDVWMSILAQVIFRRTVLRRPRPRSGQLRTAGRTALPVALRTAERTAGPRTAGPRTAGPRTPGTQREGHSRWDRSRRGASWGHVPGRQNWCASRGRRWSGRVPPWPCCRPPCRT